MFLFGPPIMRMLYMMKKPDLAYELFTDSVKDLLGFLLTAHCVFNSSTVMGIFYLMDRMLAVSCRVGVVSIYRLRVVATRPVHRSIIRSVQFL